MPGAKSRPEITAAAPIGTSVSKILLPMRLPADSLLRFFNIALTEMDNSGRLVPIPTITTAITVWSICSM